MTKTRRATSFPLFILTVGLSVSGWSMWLNQSRPPRDAAPMMTFTVLPVPVEIRTEWVSVNQRDVALLRDIETNVMPAEKVETTAQKRARFAPHIMAAAHLSAVEPALIEAVITAESGYDSAAVSKAGAVGLMQLMPDTAQRYGVINRWDPAQNILGGARYLNFLLRKFNNDHELALAAYNAGEGAVEKHRNRIPPFSETRKYVPRVLAYYQQYRAEA